MKRKYRRMTMAGMGMVSMLIAAGFSDGELLLGASNGAMAIIFAAIAVLLMLPALVHIYLRGVI